jgi:hypothetical protein
MCWAQHFVAEDFEEDLTRPPPRKGMLLVQGAPNLTRSKSMTRAKTSFLALLLLAAAILPAREAAAQQRVTISGTTYTCTNRCNVTVNPNGSFTITDCCGGQVSFRLYPV